MSNSYHLHILTEQTEDDGPVQQNGLLLRCFSLQCRRQNSNCRSIFTTKTQTQMVWVTNLTWNAPKMIYHVLSTLSGPLCSHFHLWCLQSVFTRSASLRFFFFASYLSHLELISFFSDSHFAVKNLTNHWHMQNLSAQNFFCLTCINYTAYLFSDQSTYTWIHCTLEETTPLPPTPETCYMLPRLRKEQTV